MLEADYFATCCLSFIHSANLSKDTERYFGVAPLAETNG